MIRERAGRLDVIVYFGADPLTGKEKRVSRTVQGVGRDARRKAKQLEATLIAEAQKFRADPIEIRDDVTMDELLDRWLEVARHERSTRQRTDSGLNRHIRPRLGRSRIVDLRTEHLDRLYLELEENGLAPATVVRLHGMVRAALEQAVRWRWLPENPATGARIPDVGEPDPQPPHPTVVIELLQLAQADFPELACFLRTGAATGLRRGSVCALRRSSIDFDLRLLRHTHAIGEAKGGVYEKATKTGARHPISIDTGTALALVDQLARIEKRAADLEVLLVADPYVFSWDPDGSTPWTPNSVTKSFARLRKRVAGAEQVQLRQLRHFVATSLLAAGTAITTVQGRGGWSRASTLVDTYAGWVPAGDRDAADLMGRILDGPQAIEPEAEIA